MNLFEKLFFGRLIDRKIATYQNDLMEKHCEEVQNIYKTMRGWRHDYHNHIQTMLALVDNPEKIKEYLLELNDDLNTVDTVIKTGNLMIDAILNSKLSLIRTNSIAVTAKAVVPQNLPIPEVDLCTVIGNLLDNAMEACVKQPNESERFVRIYMGVLKQQLYISVQNSVGDKVLKEGDRYISSKPGTGHGLGLFRVDRIVKKNQGYVLRKNEDGIFATEVFLPLPPDCNSCQI